MDFHIYTTTWYVILFVCGIIFLPLTALLFGRYFYDWGYAFSKTIFIISISLVALSQNIIIAFADIISKTNIGQGLFPNGDYSVGIPVTFRTVLTLIILFAIGNGFLFAQRQKKNSDENPNFNKPPWKIFIFEEILFYISFVSFMFVRAQEPSIRSLEKMMDHGFMMSIINNGQLPPNDMWLAGETINYYYFGHLNGALLTILSQIPPEISYNLILGTLFALGITLAFSLCSNLTHILLQKVKLARKQKLLLIIFIGLMGAFLVNLGGNLHTIYAFAEKYDPEDGPPQPIWEVYEPNNFSTGESEYWYPNATRFIPNTIHEFPAYSYVVADLHGHVFDIQFTLFSLALIVTLIIHVYTKRKTIFVPYKHPYSLFEDNPLKPLGVEVTTKNLTLISILMFICVVTLGATSLILLHDISNGVIQMRRNEMASVFSIILMLILLISFFDQVAATAKAIAILFIQFIRKVILFSGFSFSGGRLVFTPPFEFILVVLIGGMTAIHYMTNAMNGPISLLFAFIVLFTLFQVSYKFFVYAFTVLISFVLFSFPFNYFFKPFSSQVGINCPTNYGVENTFIVGPFLFDVGNCQSSEWWMLATLWGFFWLMLVLFFVAILLRNKITKGVFKLSLLRYDHYITNTDIFAMLLFFYGIFLTILPEYIYAKDIYPGHFRANTMFKMGYQAFIMMSIASAYVMLRLILLKYVRQRMTSAVIIAFPFFLVSIYFSYAFPSYYPGLTPSPHTQSAFEKEPKLNGAEWVKISYPQNWEIIEYLNENAPNDAVILEAQGDSYTDFNQISVFTGLPTVAGWYVHQWLWRGTPEIIQARSEEVRNFYEGTDLINSEAFLRRYGVNYVIVSNFEKEKYTQINEAKIKELGQRVFTSSNGIGNVYKID